MSTRPSKPAVYGPETRHLLVPKPLRAVPPGYATTIYRMTGADYDRLPLETFLVAWDALDDGPPLELLHVIKPQHPENYPAKNRTLGGRLLYKCWTGGMAVKSLDVPRAAIYRHVVFPGDPEFAALEAFKVLCDTKRGWLGRPVAVAPTLLYKALGLT